MSKGSEALNRIQDNLAEFVSDDYHYEDYVNDINLLEKELKALEIIKKKVIVIPFLILDLSLNDLKDYNKIMDKDRKLTQEEFDLLKEVLL